MPLKIPALLGWLALCAISLAACDGLRVDYGEPVAQFDEADLQTSATSYRNQKVTVKGVVQSVDSNNAAGPMVILEGGTTANFGRLKAMAEAIQPGQTVMIDGILRIDGEQATLVPAQRRSPDSAFDPTKR